LAQDISSIAPAAKTEPPSTQGLTSKVIKGSLWTFAGQVLPFAVSFFATPFVIRFLGAEAYGVYILMTLITSYFSFADFGMGIGSTKFGSEAYAAGSREEEAKVVRTAALISLTTSIPVAAAIVIFSFPIIVWAGVPEHLQAEASFALKLAAAALVINFLCAIFNTPQLTRLRMDLNTLVNAGFRILGILLVPVVLYFGGGIVEAVLVLLIASVLTLGGHIFVSGKLLGELFHISINRKIIKPLLKFGGALVISTIATLLLVNAEKLILARAASVETLAYYSVAFLVASMAAMFTGAMLQSLLPAFSQLLGREKKSELNALFQRALRVNIIGLMPVILILCVTAKPFFTLWAGEDFGRESSAPFYILLFGLFFNIVAYIPHSILMASGRTDIFAKIYWIELFPYLLIAALLTYKFGATGAASAWSLRVIIDAVFIIWFAKKFAGVSLDLFQGRGFVFALLVLLLFLPPILTMFFIGNYSPWLLFLSPVCLAVYLVAVWNKFFEKEEKMWITDKIALNSKR
jgi:O-antigen/teichoic acid export membrane protein